MKSFVHRIIPFLKHYRLALVIFSSGFVILSIFIGLAWWNQRDKLEPFPVLENTVSKPEQYLELGKAYEAAQQYEDAEQAYLKAINLDPVMQLAAYAALDALYQKHMHDNPEKQSYMAHLYMQGISRNPRSRVLMRSLAQLYERQKRPELAVQWFRRVLMMYPDDFATRQDLTRITGQSQQPQGQQP